jgi:hypothetical protein
MLGGRIGRHADAAGEGKNRGDVDDLGATAARQRALREGLREEKTPT